MSPSEKVRVWIEPWSADDQPVLERSNTPEMTRYLGGPESPEKIVERQARFLRLWESGEARMFTIHVDGIAEAVGSVGYWTSSWPGADVYESGWSVATAYQGNGFASQGLSACLHYAADRGGRDIVVAFPVSTTRHPTLSAGPSASHSLGKKISSTHRARRSA